MPEARILASVNREGEAEISQGGRTSRIRPHALFLVDPLRPFRVLGTMQTYSISLPPAPLRVLIPHLDALTAQAVPGDHGPGAVFRAMLEEVFRLGPTLDRDTAGRIADAVPPLLAAALGSLPAPGGDRPGVATAGNRQRVLDFIRENLDDPNLDPEAVARGVNLSLRYVYGLFSDEPVSLMRFIWRERLERCRAELASPARESRSVGEIAWSWGFSDLAHFSRCFRRRFGCSPREFRKDAARHVAS
jgi:AraC-like DNA-binding protein